MYIKLWHKFVKRSFKYYSHGKYVIFRANFDDSGKILNPYGIIINPCLEKKAWQSNSKRLQPLKSLWSAILL